MRSGSGLSKEKGNVGLPLARYWLGEEIFYGIRDKQSIRKRVEARRDSKLLDSRRANNGKTSHVARKINS